ncbi:MAG: hypothetical protein ACTSRW_01825 [Candidatus Helarchaeota archaeon]
MIDKKPYLRSSRELSQVTEREIKEIFTESDPQKLHEKTLKSRAPNKLVEALKYPFTILKYHLPISIAVYWNLKNGMHQTGLYTAENTPSASPFQIIYKDEQCE